jgi:ABC-type uncharacterized transport system substrate-binding protein
MNRSKQGRYTMKIIVLLLVSLAIVSVHLADAQQPPKKPLIGVLVAGSPSSMESRINAFQKRLRELGYKEGQNIVVEYHYAEGNYNRLTAIATDLVRSNANVIVTWAIPVTQVVKNATNTIPIVMAGGGNPVETGLVESLAKPGGNITGLATIQNELTGKRLELLKEAVPKISRVAFVFNPEGQVPTQGYEPMAGKGWESGYHNLLNKTDLTSGVKGDHRGIHEAFTHPDAVSPKQQQSIDLPPILY